MLRRVSDGARITTAVLIVAVWVGLLGFLAVSVTGEILMAR